MKERYTVETLRCGQPRPYADHEHECRISVERTSPCGENAGEWEPFRCDGWTEKQREDWAKRIVRGVFRNFREQGDDDGRTGMEAYYFPTLRWLKVDPHTGTIRALVTEAYTD